MGQRSQYATHNLFAVSAGTAETALNTEQTLDVSMLIGIDNIFKLTGRRERNDNEASGYEEITEVYDNGFLAQGDINFPRCQAQHLAFISAYALGTCASATVAGSSGGYRHTITPISDDLDDNRSNPTFTAAQRYGKILKRRFASCFVRSFTLIMAMDDWVQLSASIGATGKYTDNMLEISVTAGEDSTTLTLAAGGTDYTIEGGTDATERLKNIDYITCANVDGAGTDHYTDVTASAVDDGTPGTVTITAPGTATDNRIYTIQFIPDEEAWASFPAKVSEDPLRTTDFSITVDGKYNGTSISGGHSMDSEIKELTWSFENAGLEAAYVPGGTGNYANRAKRTNRTQTVTVNRDFLDFRMQQKLLDNEDFVLSASATGSEYESGHSYKVEIIWPKCRMVNPDENVDNKRMAETVEIAILEDATYGSVVVNVDNEETQYAA